MSISFLPGPVKISEQVSSAFCQKPFSHRSEAFKEMYHDTLRALLQLGKSSKVAMFTGSGTLANGIISQELKKLTGRGLICANGEFGGRLVQQGRQAGLDFDAYSLPMGGTFDEEYLFKALQGKTWLWLTHCETSVGSINLTAEIEAYCVDHGIKLCVDSISAFANLPVDFSNVYIASASSGKGLGAYPGISMVFYNHTPRPSSHCHPYFELNTYDDSECIPFTFSSNLLCALHTALHTTNYEERFKRNALHAKTIRSWLRQNALSTPVPEVKQANYMWTVVLGDTRLSLQVGEALAEQEIYIHYKNKYLADNGWIQIALMGLYSEKELKQLLGAIEQELA